MRRPGAGRVTEGHKGLQITFKNVLLIRRLNSATALLVSWIKCMSGAAEDRHQGLSMGRPTIPALPAPTSAFLKKGSFCA